MTRYISNILCLVFMCLALSSCQFQRPHFITDRKYRSEVNQEFKKVRELARHREKQLFSVFDQNLTRKEEEALKFLYASMPLCDLGDGNGDFFLRNVRMAFTAQDSLPWGRSIPDDVFRHFVLPYRVNNENLDSARSVFFKELYPRVRKLSMHDAALEVNHWCHEKVNYQPTDSRTISPLGAIKTAYGRCGEESTFAVTALRSVGIPARQVYTPRWAHTDDNHAWVEVWVDGKWYFMGACEPEPELNMAWFAEPVLRAMMVHTNTFGKYFGSEPVLEQSGKSSKLNLLANYTDTRELVVKVLDTTGQAIPSASVEFGLYNYAEFFPLKQVRADDRGVASLTTGYGDLQILASDSAGHLGIVHTKAQDFDTVVVELRQDLSDHFGLDFLNVPPIERKTTPAHPAGAEFNKIRLEKEDSIRRVYESSFITESEAKALAMGWDMDTALVWRFLKGSRGNWPEIKVFLGLADVSNKELALDLLGQLAEKDLHDIQSATLRNHLDNVDFGGEALSKGLFLEYILNPRVELEMISPYRSVFNDWFEDVKGTHVAYTMGGIIDWIKKYIDVDSVNNYYNLPITPLGVFELRRSDPRSRDIFFVALARSLGIPARLEPATRIPQYFDKAWIDVDIDGVGVKTDTNQKASLYLEYEAGDKFDPEYYVHFTIAQWKDNRFVTLEYDWNKALSSFTQPIILSPGYYRILTGHRNEDGSVGIRQSFFPMTPGELVQYIIGFNNAELEWGTHGVWTDAPISSDNKAIIAWLDPKTEPGKHFLNEVQSLKTEFEEEKAEFLVYCFNADDIGQLTNRLPSNASIKVDSDRSMLALLEKAIGEDDGIAMPLFLVLNERKEIVLIQSGYNIGTPEWLLRAIQQE